MNHTTEDSNKMKTLVGGETIASEDGKIVMPPENAKDITPVIENIENGNAQYIMLGKVQYLNDLSNKQLEEFLEVKRKGRPYDYKRYEAIVKAILDSRKESNVER